VKRIFVACAALVLALMLAATAFAATRHFSGKVESGGKVSLDTKYRDGKNRRVKTPVKFENVPISCDPPYGDTALDYTLGGDPLKVRHREFSFKSAPGRPNETKIWGKFSRSGRKVHGTFRSHGTYAGGAATGCDTGTQDWRAHRVR
jgi:hypothetical protein